MACPTRVRAPRTLSTQAPLPGSSRLSPAVVTPGRRHRHAKGSTDPRRSSATAASERSWLPPKRRLQTPPDPANLAAAEPMWSMPIVQKNAPSGVMSHHRPLRRAVPKDPIYHSSLSYPTRPSGRRGPRCHVCGLACDRAHQTDQFSPTHHRFHNRAYRKVAATRASGAPVGQLVGEGPPPLARCASSRFLRSRACRPGRVRSGR